MKNSLTILGAALIIGLALYLGLSHRVPSPPPREKVQASLQESSIPARFADETSFRLTVVS